MRFDKTEGGREERELYDVKPFVVAEKIQIMMLLPPAFSV